SRHVAISYRRDRWRGVSDSDVLKFQRAFYLLKVDDGVIGALQFFRYKTDWPVSNLEFRRDMDSEGGDEANLAPVLTRSWPQLWDSVICCGDILELRYL